MPYDWRREQEEANQRRAREEEIAAQQAAWNRKLEEDARKSAEFWKDKMEEDRRRAAQEREKDSTGCPATIFLGFTAGAFIISLLRVIAW